MKNKLIYWVLLSSLMLVGTASVGQELKTITRREVAAAYCPAEMATLIALEVKSINLDDSNPIGIDPSFKQATTDAFNKYVVSVVVLAEHVGSIIGLGDPVNQTQLFFDRASAEFDLSRCLTLTPAERDLVIGVALQADDPVTYEEAEEAFFEGANEYGCGGFGQASVEILHLNPESSAFQSEYEDIMSSIGDECN